MSWKLQDQVWEMALPSTGKLVLLALANRAGASGSCYPSVSDLSVQTGLDVKTVRKAILFLEKEELIYVERRERRSSIFQLSSTKFTLELPPDLVVPKTVVPPKTVLPNLDGGTTKFGSELLPNLVPEHINNKSITDRSNQEAVSISSCFSSFGQNPVSAPTRWEPDEENVYDLPVQQQAAMARKVDVDIDDHDHVLTATEMVVLAAQLGYRLTRNVVIDEIAERKTLTVKMLAEACQRTRDNSGGIGYLVRILQNASKDPDAFNGVRKVPDITAENITDKQCYLFAKKLANYHPFASRNAKYMEEESAMVERLTGRLKDKEFFEHCRPTLVKLGCLKGATA